jgi:predicted house-cleaning noncanonical NTP pyrophosphatase (MazG superfamily)
MMPTYNKLIRDRILEIIEKDNLAYNARVLEPEEHLTEIKKKLYEEVKEFDETTNEQDGLEEMADILELLHAALKVYGKTFEELEEVRVHKKEKRGGFDKGLYLIDVEDK